LHCHPEEACIAIFKPPDAVEVVKFRFKNVFNFVHKQTRNKTGKKYLTY
jgi:hypothetical protein